MAEYRNYCVQSKLHAAINEMTKRTTYRTDRLSAVRIREQGSTYLTDASSVRTTIDLEPDRHRRLKVYAAQQGVKIADLVRNWIDQHCI